MPRFLDPEYRKMKTSRERDGRGAEGKNFERERESNGHWTPVTAPASLPSKIQRHLQSSSILRIPLANQTFQVHEDRRPKIRRSKWIQIFSDTFLSYPSHSGKEVQLQIELERKSLRDHTNLQNIKWRDSPRSDASQKFVWDTYWQQSDIVFPGVTGTSTLRCVCIAVVGQRGAIRAKRLVKSVAGDQHVWG